jgi:Domain of unknown function (DUF1707)
MAIETSRRVKQGRPDLRALREDLATVVEMLGVVVGAGRLYPAQLDARVEAALTARTHSDVAILTVGRPADGQPSDAAWPTAADAVRVGCGSAGIRRDGQRALSWPIQVRAASDRVRLDPARTVVSQPDLEVDVSVRRDGVTLVTKPGIEVETGDVPVGSDVGFGVGWLLCQS